MFFLTITHTSPLFLLSRRLQMASPSCEAPTPTPRPQTSLPTVMCPGQAQPLSGETLLIEVWECGLVVSDCVCVCVCVWGG